MTFAGSVRTCFSKYAVFAGRAARSEFWWFQLVWPLAVLLLTAIYQLAPSSGPVVGVSVVVVYVLLLLPTLAVTVRRLHDRNRSGWNILWGWVPAFGAFVLVIWFCKRGVPGDNRFGADPLAQERAS